MELLLSDLRATHGIDDLQLIIINGYQDAGSVDALRRRTTFPVIQETPEEPLWTTLDGHKDDLFLYDRCGRLAYFLPFPLGMLAHRNNSIPRQLILDTSSHSICGSDSACHPNGTTAPQGTPSSLSDTEGDQAPTSEGVLWRAVHLMFGPNRHHHSSNSTSGQDEGRGDEHFAHVAAICNSSATVNKSTCFDWPQERVQRVRHCCNRANAQCGSRLTRRRCIQFRPLVTCCPLLRQQRDRRLSSMLEEIS